VKEFAVHADVINIRVGFRAELGDPLPVDLHAAGGDQLLCLPARCDAGSGNDFL
jgi:hypothetical protein